jgi:S-adenosylmethionine decarboxylase
VALAAKESRRNLQMDMGTHSPVNTKHKRTGASYDPELPTKPIFLPIVPSCLGHHLIVDMQNASELANPRLIQETLRSAALCAGATLLNLHVHVFAAHGGITCTASLAESHISIHTWPEHGYAALDVFMCGKCNPYACLPDIVKAFGPENIEIQEIIRGASCPPAPTI